MKLFNQLICYQITKDGSSTFQPLQCTDSTTVQARLSELLTYCKIVTGITSLFIIPYLCKLSDRIGRKMVLLIVHFSLLFSVLTVITVWNYQYLLSYEFIVFSALFEGVANSIVVMNLLSAYISDCVIEENRTKSLSQVFCGTTLGYILGPIIGSYIYQQYGNTLVAPYIACTILIVISIVVVVTIFPESLSKESQERAKLEYKDKAFRGQERIPPWERRGTTKIVSKIKSWFKAINSVIVQPYYDLVSVLNNTKTKEDRQNLINVVIIDVLFAILSYGIDALIINYFLYTLKATIPQLGYTIAVSAILRVVSLGISPYLGEFFEWVACKVSGSTFAERLESEIDEDGMSNNQSYKIRRQDVYVMRVANVIETLGLITIGFSGISFRIAMIGVFLIGLGVMSRPNVLAAMINVCPQRDVGKFMGAKGPFEIIISVIGASLLLWIYGVLVSMSGDSEGGDKPSLNLSGIVFYIAGAMYSLTIWVSFRFKF